MDVADLFWVRGGVGLTRFFVEIVIDPDDNARC